MPTFRLIVFALLLCPMLASAQVGRFLLSAGDVSVLRGAQVIRATFGTPVQQGDTIRVGTNSNAQIRMTDESILGLRSGTQLRIDEYAYAGREDRNAKSIFSLLAGGFRTVTGVIGRLSLSQRDAYAVRTPTSTIGIRGTHYVVVHCNDDCGPPKRISLAMGPLAQTDAGQPGVGQNIPNGTYGGVTDGRIGVTNNLGERQFGSNEYFFVADQNTAPQSLIAPPNFLYDRLEGQSRSQGKKGEQSNESVAGSGVNAESRPSQVPAAPAPNPFIVTEEKTATGTSTVITSAGLDTGALAGWITPGSFNDLVAGGALISQTNLTIGAGGLVTAFSIPAGCIGPNDGCQQPPSSPGLGTPVEAGSATFPSSTQKVFWGRWASGTIVDGSQTITLGAATQAHLMYGPLTPDTVIASKTGSLTLQSFSLGTTPSNNFGALGGSTGLPPLLVNFTSRTVSADPWFVNFPNVGSGTQNWSFSGPTSGALVISNGQGAYFLIDNIAGTCSSSGTACSGTSSFTAKGRVAGIFLGPAGDHAGVAIGGAAGSSQFNTVRVYCVSGC
jgi:hypothetical protein